MKYVIVIAVLYVLSPVDLIPEFIPGVGSVDDAVVALLGMLIARRRDVSPSP
jgi:uncharacterized membrane protein YkvA (DUF1232 family)